MRRFCPVDCIHPTPDEPDYDQVEQLYIDARSASTAMPASRLPSTRSRPKTWFHPVGRGTSRSTRPTSRARCLRAAQRMTSRSLAEAVIGSRSWPRTGSALIRRDRRSHASPSSSMRLMPPSTAKVRRRSSPLTGIRVQHRSTGGDAHGPDHERAARTNRTRVHDRSGGRRSARPRPRVKCGIGSSLRSCLPASARRFAPERRSGSRPASSRPGSDRLLVGALQEGFHDAPFSNYMCKH